MTSLYEQLDPESRKAYQRSISAAASLSRLFSDNLYLNSKLMERAFCKYLDAENVALDDVPIDAKIHTAEHEYGIGLKTFGHDERTKLKTEKIAEFDKLKRKYTHKVQNDAELVIDSWNNRLDETRAVYGIDDYTYHCLTRHGNTISIVECGFTFIDPCEITAKESTGGFFFEYDNVKYRYNYGKSVLMRGFDVTKPIESFDVKVMDDPFSILGRLYAEILDEVKPIESFNAKAREDPFSIIGRMYGEMPDNTKPKPTLILPLFGYKHGIPTVFPKSGLNQWNADGRPRSLKEVYIPYNKREQDLSPGFFPEYKPGHRGDKQHFVVHLPNGKQFNASRCQSGGKGIMSQDNSDFGEWLLHDVLNVEPGAVVTLDTLEERGINAVIFTKNSDEDYSIDFTYVDPYSIDSDSG